ALFAARIHPKRAAGRISRKRYQRLARAVRATLKRAIAAGGTTLRDFRNARGEPGYFQLHAQVYAREGAPCLRCGRPIRAAALGGRRVFYCNYCQL
ncbi:MAG: zinc finger domain-containing protein, partial [Acidiferrobacterales bacterium]